MNAAALIAGCVQLNPGEDRAANIERAVEGVREAARRGAKLITLPEYATFLHASGGAMRSAALPEADDPALPRLRALAKELDAWILIGSLALAADGDKLANRGFAISPDGGIAARYDKLHMFDATLANGRQIRESSTYAAGRKAVVVQTPWARLGLSICYDVRFPLLYRALAQAGAEILVVPAAFTQATGALHWETLLRARAIENAAYVLAPATCGAHPGGHQTFGHSMIIDPDGKVIARAADEPAVIVAEIDVGAVARARARIPALTHDRAFEIEQGAHATPADNQDTR